MNIKTLLDIIVVLNIIIVVVVFVIETFTFRKMVKKSLDKLSKSYDDYFNCLVQNEYDKQDIYKRLADLEEKQK